jgi:hypothetical protein
MSTRGAIENRSLPAIRFQHQDARQAQPGAAYGERVTGDELQEAGELGFGPHFTTRRTVADRLGRRVDALGDQQLSAQGIRVVDGLQLHQL